MIMRLSLFACLALWPVNSIAAADEPAGASPRVLLHCDLSAGALPDAWVVYHARSSAGDVVTLSTTTGELEALLSDDSWSEVVIAVRWATEMPLAAQMARSFSAAHGETPVHLFAWHDNGQVVAGGRSAIAGTAMTTWWHDTTTTGYAVVKNPPKTLLESSGLKWPDFAGIVVADPRVEMAFASAVTYILTPPVLPSPAQSSPETGATTAAAAADTVPDPNCVALERSRYFTDVAKCDADEAERDEACEKLYGQEGRTPDPEQHLKCKKEADADHTKCMEIAKNKYDLKLKLCPQVPAPPAQ